MADHGLHRRTALACLPTLALAGVRGAAAADATWARIQATKTLRIVMASGYPPFSFIGPDGNQSGFDTDLVKAFAARHGLDADIKLIAFDGIIPALIGRQTDMVVSIYATEARRKVVDFTRTYWTASSAFITRAGTPQINSLADASGKSVGVLQGGASQNLLATKAPDVKLVAYKGGPVEYYRDLAIGRIDAAFDNQDVASWYLSKQPGSYQFSGDAIAALFPKGEFAWAIRKEDTDLLAAADAFLAGAAEDGTIQKLAQRYALRPR